MKKLLITLFLFFSIDLFCQTITIISSEMMDVPEGKTVGDVSYESDTFIITEKGQSGTITFHHDSVDYTMKYYKRENSLSLNDNPVIYYILPDTSLPNPIREIYYNGTSLIMYFTNSIGYTMFKCSSIIHKN